MIAKGTTHNNGAKLAKYMTESQDGQRAELWQLRGFEATNIKDAFRDVQIMAEATKCEQPFFHVQVRNRDGEILTRQQFEYAADRIERMLGLSDQPRAITFHTYEHNNEQHMHVAWSRIDQDTLTAKPLPFFKERLKKISRELELHFGLEPVTNHREGHIKYAPTRAEHEQARRLGVDIHEIRNTIRACWDHSDNGRSFEAALADKDLILARGDQRDFAVIDHEGGMHVLGKRILDVSAAKIRTRMSDLVRDELPSVLEVRAFVVELKMQKQHEQPAEVWDRERDTVRDEIHWQEALDKAAIAKEARERQFVEPKDREKETRAGRQEKGQGVPQNSPAPELGKTQGEIRLARSLSHGPQGFANALEDRGYILACITSDDIQSDIERLKKEWEERRRNPQTWMEHEGGFAALTSEHQQGARRSFDNWKKENEKKQSASQGNRQAKEQQNGYKLEDYVEFVQKKWRQGPKSQLERAAGGLAVLTPFGTVYTLTPRNTGLDRDELPHYLKGIDRAPLLSVTDAQAVTQDVRDQRREEWFYQRREEWSARQPLRKTDGEIRLAYSLTSTGQEFANALEDRGHILARMTEADAERLNRWERQRLKEEWRAPAPSIPGKVQTTERTPQHKYRAGELVAVNPYGQIFQLTLGNTGHDAAARAERLQDIDLAPLLSVTAAENVMKKYQQHRQEERQEERHQKRDEWQRATNEKHAPAHTPQHQSWPGFEKAATAATQDERTQDLRGPAAQVWAAWCQTDDDKVIAAALAGKTVSFAVPTKEAFAASLHDRGISFAAVTKEEAERSHREAEFAKAVGNYAPRFKEGEIVIVTEPRAEYRRDDQTITPPRVHKLGQSLAQKFTKHLGIRSELQGIDATLKASDQRAQQRAADRETIRDVYAETRLHRNRTTVVEKGIRNGATTTRNAIHKSAAAIGKTASIAASVGKMFETVGNLVEAFAVPKLTPQQIHEGEKAKDRREAAAETTIDFSRYSADEAQQRRQMEQDREADRHRPRDRDGGGRER
jgi:hypothetical protein